MRLADFILRNMEAIVAQWEAFAATLLPAAANMKSPALRDHAADPAGGRKGSLNGPDEGSTIRKIKGARTSVD